MSLGQASASGQNEICIKLSTIVWTKEQVPTLELHTGINSFHFDLDPSGGKDWHGELKHDHTVAHQALLSSPSMLGTMQAS